MCLHLKCKRKFADFAPYFPLVEMLVPQGRVSKRSVEQIAEFEVVSVISINRGTRFDAMNQMASVAPHASDNFCDFSTSERHQRLHCFHRASGGHRDI